MSGLSTTRDMTTEPSAFHTTQKNVKEMFSGNPSLVDLWKANGLDSPTENLTSVEDLNLATNDKDTEENIENSENVNTEEVTLTNKKTKPTSELEEKTETRDSDSGSKTETETREEDTDEDSIPPWMIFGGVTASVGILTALALRKRG